MTADPEQREKRVVIGVGNEVLMDEGVGVVVARALKEQPLPADVVVVEGGVAGLDLLFEMEDATRVVIVDAAEMELPPGTIRVLTPEMLETEGLRKLGSLHHISLMDVLELGKMTGLAAEVLIVAIQPGEVAPGLRLTDAVAQVVPDAAAKVRALLADSN